MNREMIILVVIGLLLVVSLVQAFQLSGLTSTMANLATRPNPAAVTQPTTQPTTSQPSIGGSGMVGGC